MKHNNWFQIFALLVVVSLVLTACATTTTPTTAPTQVKATTTAPTIAPALAATQYKTGENTIIIGTTDSIASLDPVDANTPRDYETIKNISEGLIVRKPGSTELQPGLAMAMPTISADGLTYTFTLKDGIKFGDGTPLDAIIYAQQLNRLLTIGPTCPDDIADVLATSYVKSIEAPDVKTIIFTLYNPIAYFTQILATPAYTASDPNIFPADKCMLFPAAPIYGVGPWYIASYTQKEQMVLKPNPYYTGELKPQVDRIIMRDYADANTLSLAVQNGEIDLAWRVLSPNQITPLKSVPGLTIGTINGGGTTMLLINHTMKPTDDPNVDKAIASAIDRNAIADTVFSGNVIPLYSLVPPGFLGATKVFDSMYNSPNVDEAKKYLEASGYSASKPLKLDLWYTPEGFSSSASAMMELIKRQLESTGEIQVTLKSQEWSTYLASMIGGQSYAIALGGWWYDYPDASNYMDPVVYNKGLGTNLTTVKEGSSYGEPIQGVFNGKVTQLMNLLMQADVEQDPVKRVDFYEQAQEVAADIVAYVPLYSVPEHVVYRSNIHGSSSYPNPEALNIASATDFNYALLYKNP